MTPASTITQNYTKQLKVSISFRLLLGLYSIVPICLLLQFCDSLFLNSSLLESLPNSPSHFLLFQILFGTPHILASSILLSTNNEYLRCYKPKLILMTLLIIAIFGIGSLFIPYIALYITAAFWTVYHVLKQQIGVGRSVYRLPDSAFYLLLWLSVGAGVFIYLGIFLKNTVDVQQAEWIKTIAAALCIGLVLASISCQRYIDNQLGKIFLWANTLLVVGSFYLYAQQYYFLAILMPRLVHDATAYIFYVTHDYNKHALQPKNWLYQAAKSCNIHVFLVLPVLSMLLTVVLQVYGDNLISFITQTLLGVEFRKAITLGLIGYLSLMHYYTESFIWKQGSPLRQFIAFKK
jgi:ABC-type multidrug transport system fused ATPase/permease subunit